MIRDILMPQLAMGMSEGTIVEWAAAEGGRITRDAPLVSIETEKVVTDIPAPYAGWLHRMAGPGDAIPVENVIGKIADTEAEYQALIAADSALSVVAPEAAATATVSSPALPSVSGGGEPVEARGRIRASGLARKLAANHGLDLSRVEGSGPGGRVVRRDVEAAFAVGAAEQRQIAQPATVAAAGVLGEVGSDMRVRARIPMTGMRKVIADRMLRSKTTAAHTYVFFEVDVTRLMAARAVMLGREKEIGARISMVALYAKALSLALRHVPNCNATLQERDIVLWDNVNIGIAVALPGKTEYESGLVVPVLRDVDRKSVAEIDRDIKALVDKAKSGRLTGRDTSDGTVTLSSSAGFMPGQWCVATPLLNQPQVLNFQPGSPVDKPIVVDGQIVVRTMLPCGLSFDHRAVDGEPVARFNRKISDLLANPELMLL